MEVVDGCPHAASRWNIEVMFIAAKSSWGCVPEDANVLYPILSVDMLSK
jgi:hypothetical protein